jgi:uncharacterized protein
MVDFHNGDYEPMFMQDVDGDSDLLIVDDWCEGFLRGLDLWGDMTPQDRQQLEKDIDPILFFAAAESGDALQAMDSNQIEALQQSIQPRIEKIYLHYRRRPAAVIPTTFVRAIPKVGRNDPCPCGSGKKYKKCCGLN